jgi:peptidoglycan L-alanyl-D-glutamate endopeptidase CwlK
MAANLDLLVPEFRDKVLELLAGCKARGYEMRPCVSLRDPYEQARLWRQSRSTEEINKKIQEIEGAGATFLAQCLRSVGPQHGDPVTNALPGLSWHQWGEAADCFWLVDGKAEWSTKKIVAGQNGYEVYANGAEAIGLTAGGHWKKLKDWLHVQLRSADSPLAEMSLREIDTAMKQRFGG